MKRQTGAGTIAALALATVFGATMLLSLATGAGVYRSVAERVEQGAAERVGLTYITAKIHGYDAAGAVYAGRFDGLDAIFLEQTLDSGVYETVLYVHDGWLKELLRERGQDNLTPAAGQTVAEAQALSVTMAAEGLMELTYTDVYGYTETTHVWLRGEGS